jgi:hypothetical protein
MKKTNINLIVNGIKVYTRKTTGRPYTHALVQHEQSGWKIVSCSSKGTAALQRMVVDFNDSLDQHRARVAAGPTEYHSVEWLAILAKRIERWEATTYYIVEIIDNTVTIA